MILFNFSKHALSQSSLGDKLTGEGVEAFLYDTLNTVLCVLFQIDLHFMKKIPAGAEACNVLVGELEFLNKPVVAFVRLSPAVMLNGLAEVPITTRLLQAATKPVQLLLQISLIYLAQPCPTFSKYASKLVLIQI